MGLHKYGNIPVGSHFEKRPAAEKEYISFRDVFSFLRSNILVIGIFGIIGTALGVTYLIYTPPTYEATARLVMDPQQGRIISQDTASGTVIIESAEIASQVEIVKSEAVAEAVIRQLDLTNDPEILNDRSWRSVVRGFFGSIVKLISHQSTQKTASPFNKDDLMQRTMDAFLSRVSVERVGQSYILQIGYRSNDPQKAAKTANALAEAYIHNGMVERTNAAKRGAVWLGSRLEELGRKARQAAIAAEEFRNQNGITAIGNATTLDEQQLSEISKQVLAAKSATAEETAKLATLMKIIKGEAPDDSMEETANNTQIQKLREDIRTAQTRLDSLKSRYDEGNPAIVATEAEIARMRSAIKSEFRRIEAIQHSDLEVAKTREQLVEAQFSALSQTGAEKNIARVKLSEIESRANTYRRLYETVLQQLSAAVQTQSFPLGKARIVTAATAPFHKTWPKTSVVLPFSLTLGLTAGLLWTLVGAEMDRRISSSPRLWSELGISSLGRVPVYESQTQSSTEKPALSMGLEPLRSVLDEPYSPFSESLRNVKNSLGTIMPDTGCLVVGVTSVGPGEGKTTISVNLAQLCQNEGQSVLLIDADFISTKLTKLAISAAEDFSIEPINLAEFTGTSNTDITAEHFDQRRSRSDTACKSANTSVDCDLTIHTQVSAAVPLLTTEQTRQTAKPGQRYGHIPALKEIIEKLRKHYKVIVVDMSDFENSADTRAICTYLDGVVLVIGNPNKMTIDRLANALKTFGASRFSLLGVIFNRCGPTRRFTKYFS